MCPLCHHDLERHEIKGLPNCADIDNYMYRYIGGHVIWDCLPNTTEFCNCPLSKENIKMSAIITASFREFLATPAPKIVLK